MTRFDLRRYPTSTGVYLMTDDKGEILYVGKAKNLRSRLRSYLQSDRDGRPQIRFLMDRATKIETIVTDTEKEALILENTLIKKHRPRYNIHLRDDKTFVSLRIDLQEEFPMLEIVRQVRKDGARYFGPYASTSSLRQTLKELYRIFPLRHYSPAKCRQRGRPCLFHQIGQCSAPCHGFITQSDYRKHVDGVIALLEGRKGEVVDLLRLRMAAAAEDLKYEDAALLRDQIQAIEKTIEHQKAVRHSTPDQDVIGFHKQEGEVEIVVLFYRQGKLSARRAYNLNWQLGEDQVLTDFLARFYDRDVPIPNEVMLPFAIEGLDSMAEWLSDRRGSKVSMRVPKRGESRRLVMMANRNAEESFKERGSRDEARHRVLQEIKRKLTLRKLPQRIECFDVSTIHGQATVASMAVVVDGEPAPSEYRHYQVRTVTGTDDYASMHEVLSRRLHRGLGAGLLPDLILIDGGKGQLSVLSAVLEEMSLTDIIDIAGLAKSRVKANVQGRSVERSEERLYLPGRKNPVILRRGSAELFLLERIRDEAHRFAIKYHRKIRQKSQLKSSLEDIPGIGPARRKTLLKYFGSLKRVRAATLPELQNVPELSATLAEQVYSYFRTNK